MPTISQMPIQPPKIILYGPPGSGKTLLTMTLGEKIQLLCLDPSGWSSARSYKDEFYEARSKCDIIDCTEVPTKAGSGFDKCKTHVYSIVEQIRQGKYPFKAIALDSLTTLTSQCLRYILANSGILDSFGRYQLKKAGSGALYSGVDKPHYGLMANEIMNLIYVLHGINLPVFLLAHETEEDIEGGITKKVPHVLGQKVGPELLKEFYEIWYINIIEGAAGKTTRVIQSVQSPRITAKSRDNLGQIDISIGMPKILEKIGHAI